MTSPDLYKKHFPIRNLKSWCFLYIPLKFQSPEQPYFVWLILVAIYIPAWSLLWMQITRVDTLVDMRLLPPRNGRCAHASTTPIFIRAPQEKALPRHNAMHWRLSHFVLNNNGVFGVNSTRMNNCWWSPRVNGLHKNTPERQISSISIVVFSERLGAKRGGGDNSLAHTSKWQAFGSCKWQAFGSCSDRPSGVAVTGLRELQVTGLRELQVTGLRDLQGVAVHKHCKNFPK